MPLDKHNIREEWANSIHRGTKVLTSWKSQISSCPSLHPVIKVFRFLQRCMQDILWLGGRLPHRVKGMINWFDRPTAITDEIGKQVAAALGFSWIFLSLVRVIRCFYHKSNKKTNAITSSAAKQSALSSAALVWKWACILDLSADLSLQLASSGGANVDTCALLYVDRNWAHFGLLNWFWLMD